MKVKIYILILLIIFIPSILFSEEFRGLKWGIDMNEIINFESDFIFFNRSGNIRSYIRRGEKKEIERTIIKSIQYLFYKNKFCGSWIEFNGADRFRDLREIFFNKYGKVKRQDRPSSEEYDYMWKHGEVLINLNYLGIQDEGKIRYYYITIWDQMGKDEKSQY